ncbi:hypothetical protein LCGC14_0504150 [marine sediment metagenome]|uniref:MCM C-terminal AAA(+) ATPase domain-containing protein n=1 Tax=marine sediment metagenome TaxID=412755 RepID=A0A0F9S322_9ZZZZ
MAEQYKDIHWVNADGTRPRYWFRIPENQIEQWVQGAKDKHALHIFTTIQTFFNKEVQDNEEVDMPFFMDFDGKIIVNGKETFDPKVALERISKTIKHFESLGLDNAYISCWFSGNKGFHLTVPSKCFGADVSTNLVKIWRYIANDIATKADLEMFDDTVYSRRRMWRVENTIHGDSGLYKIPLGTDEILGLDVEHIKNLATKEQVPHFEEYHGSPIEQLEQLYQQALDNHTISGKFEYTPLKISFDNHPPCIQNLLNKGLLELGTTNLTMFLLTAYFKWQETPMDQTYDTLCKWAENIKPTVSHDLTPQGMVDLEKVKKEIHQVCRSVYSGKQYSFSCNGIKQIPGVEAFCTQECQDSLEVRIETSLFNALQAKNLGKRLYIAAEAVGRRDTAYMIPKTVKYWCKPVQSGKCASCPLYESPDGITINISIKSPGILLFLLPSNQPLIAKVGQLGGLPSRRGGGGGCSVWHFDVEYQNVEIIYIAPMVANQYSEEDRYTRQTIYYVGHGLEPNRGYEFSGYVHIHDKTNVAVLVIDQAEPLADTLSTFKMTPKMRQRSKVFQPGEHETYESKHKHIAETLNYHICRVWGREIVIRAVDLVYHSVNQFLFQREIINGRLDILLAGDTRQGKSKIAEMLMRHFDLGVKISGEAARRTGVLFTIVTKENEPSYITWGVLPRHHRRLVFIDEANKFIADGGFAELTEARSSGEVTVTQAVFGKAKCATRLITLTNAIGKKTMGTYFYPVLALLDLLPERQDISRFTYAVGMSSNQIDDEMINLNIEDLESKPNPYVDQICHDHVLWAWKLEPDMIKISDKVERLILKFANVMCQQYVATIPLVEPGDFRHKLAKIAVAVAVRMYSVNKNNELLVTPEAVRYAYNFLNELYSEPSMKYLAYSKSYTTFTLREEDKKRLLEELKQRWQFEHEFLIRWLMINEYTRPKELAIAGQFLEKEIKDCLSWFTANKLLDTTARGHFVKTELGVKFVEYVLPDEFDGTYITAEEVEAEVDDGF